MPSFRGVTSISMDNLGAGLKEWMDMKEMTLKERKAYIQAVADEVAQGQLTLGGAVKRLRENLLGVSQERFALASKISKRALSQLEVDSGNPTLATLEAVFKKFGLQISLAHLSPIDLNAVAAKKSNAGFGIATATPSRTPVPSTSKPT
ncbi:helix-turn-helix domain-containing protein [Pseudomonas sp. MWU318]|uniref:helix-turn-helix domain-containing protein n=1 Tax=Pseudomonas sp. MWU318 TaxID=2802569 RepID=UPI001F18083A|nr:helix-turn-helix transcriptional regulator [Pseudomonas sp. MWU318]